MQSIPHTVLIIDDSPEDRLACRRFLERDIAASYHCIEVATAAEALVRCREQLPEVVLLDYMLPDEDGLTVLATLIAEHGQYTFALLLLTGAGDQQLAVAAMKLGAHDYLVKGAQLEHQLSRAVAGAIEKVSLQRALVQERQALVDRNAQLQEALMAVSIERQLLNVTLASIGDGVITTDAQGRITFLNGEAERLTGWPNAEAAGQPLSTVFRIVNEDTRAAVDDPAAKVLATGLVVGLANHTVLIARDGREIPIDDSAAPIRQADGTLSGVVLVFHDVSVQKQAEATLHVERDRFVKIVETVPSIVCAYQQRPDGTASFPYASPRITEIYGVPPEALAKDAAVVTTLWHPDDISEILASIQLSRRQMTAWRHEFRVCHPTRGELWIEGHALPQEEGDGSVVWYGVLTDITQRKRAAVVLHESEERFRLIVEGAQDYALFMVSLDGRVASWNVGAERIKGYTADEIIGQNFTCFYTPEDAARGWPAHLLATAAADGYVEDAGWRVRKDGTRFWASVVLTAMRDVSGKLRGFSNLTHDMSEHKRAEAALQRSAARLQLLADASHAFAEAGADYQGLLDQIVQTIGEQIGAACVIRLLSEDQQWFDVVALYHQDATLREYWLTALPRLSILEDAQNPVALVMHSGQPLLFAKIDQQSLRERYSEMREALDRFRPYSAMLTPLRIHGRSIGSIVLIRFEAGQPPFDEGDLALAQDLADRAALAIGNARLLHQVQHELAERAIGQEQLRYQAELLAQVTDAIISTDLSFTIKSWNAAAEALYGWPATEAIGRAMSEIVPTEYRDNDAELVRAAFLREGRWRGEVVQQHRDGTRWAIMSSVNLLKDSAGNPVGAVAVNRDITERKQAEQALERSNQRLRVLAEASGAFAKSGGEYQGLLAQVAQHTAETLQSSCTIRMLSGDAQWLDVVALGHYDPALLQAMQKLIRPERMPIDDPQPAAFAARSGQPLLIPVVDTASLPAIIPATQQPLLAIMAPHTIISLPLRAHGRTIGSLTFARSAPALPPFDEEDLTLGQDLADRAALAIGNARLLQQVQRAANRLEHLRAIDQAIIAERALAEIAEAAVSHIEHLMPTTRVGVALLNLQARTWTVLALQVHGVVHQPTSAEAPLEIFGAAIEPLMRGQVYQVADVAALPELPGFLRAGQAEQIRAYFHMPIMAGDALLGLLNVGTDTPQAFTPEHIEIAREVAAQLSIAIQQARLREQIARHAQELEQRVAARTAELTAANKELEAFSYSVSHDLRAPLRAVDGFSRILQEEYIASLPDEAQHYFGMLRNGAQQMGHLIDDLLAFSRLSRQPLSTLSVDPAELVRTCLQELREEQGGRRIDLSVGTLPSCQGDPALLKQVWLNLIGNALKYTRQRDPARITIGSQAQDGETIYFVRDNGAGFDMRYSDKLFGVFQRLHRAEEYEGTGVGLAIVQRIIHRHGGRIWAEAAVDQGATFYFALGEN
jgi:PAS domain S-box-containing protein